MYDLVGCVFVLCAYVSLRVILLYAVNKQHARQTISDVNVIKLGCGDRSDETSVISDFVRTIVFYFRTSTSTRL